MHGTSTTKQAGTRPQKDQDILLALVSGVAPSTGISTSRQGKKESTQIQMRRAYITQS
jgi:hypothetical protein